MFISYQFPLFPYGNEETELVENNSYREKKTYFSFKREQTVTDEPLSTETASSRFSFNSGFIFRLDQGIINRAK